MNELVDSEAVLSGELQATDIADARLEKKDKLMLRATLNRKRIGTTLNS